MSVTQYIGARYLPLFATPEQWSSERAYEPLTIVLHEGNSYTSKQAVPIGIDIQNNEFWALTGNYNAQVEAYRQEVMQFDGRIDALEDLTEQLGKELNIYMYDGSGRNNYTTTLVRADGANILIDTGATADNTGIISWATGMGVDKLDALILTHMHNDHVQNYQGIINGLCNEDTKIYTQMEPGDTNDEYRVYQDYALEISQFIASKGYPAMIVPNNAETLYFGEDDALKVTFFNTDTSLRTAYDNSWANMTDAYTIRKSSLNNYSLQVLFEVGSSSYWESGDLEGEGQKQMYKYARPVTLAKNPHHLYNKAGYETFYNRLNPEFWLVSNHFNEDWEQEQVSGALLEISYIGRYLRYNSNNTLLVTNLNNNVYFNLKDGKVFNFDGHIIDTDYSRSGDRAAIHYAAILPTDVDCYQDNPYFYMSEDFTLEYLHTIVRTHWNYANFPFSGFYIPIASTGYAGNSPFAQAVRDIWASRFGINLDSTVMYISMGRYCLFEFGWPTIDIPYSNLRMNTVSGNELGNYTFIDIDKGKIDLTIEGTFQTGDNVSSDPNWSYLSRCQIMGAETNEGAIIPMIKTSTPKTATARHSGSLTTANGQNIYTCILTSAGNITFKLTNIATGEVTDSADGNFKIVKLMQIV